MSQTNLKKKYAVVRGSKVRYLHGGSGKPLLFLHGWSTNPLSHIHSLEIIAESFTVYAPFIFDMKIKNVQDMAESMNEFIKTVGIQETAIAGTSFGALIAGLAAYLQPNKVSRLLLINAVGVPIEVSPLKMSMDAIKSYAGLLLKLRLKVIWHRFVSGIHFHISFLKKGMRDLAKELKYKTHYCHVFSALKVKTIIIWSSKDIMFPVSMAHSLKSLIANSELIIKDGNHAWHYHEPELFAQTIVAACNSE